MLENLVARFGKQRYLAVSLMVYFAADGLLPSGTPTSRLVSFGVLGMLILAGPMAVAHRSWQTALVAVLAWLMVGPGLVSSLLTSTSAYQLSLVAGSLFFFMLILLIGRDLLFRFREVTSETLWAAINVYLLVGMLFSFLYALADSLIPGAFNGTTNMAGNDVQAFLYFSFITLTTLGYGDITPAAPAVMTLSYVEALIGQLYVAILIARLVSLYSSQQARKEKGLNRTEEQ